MPFYVWGHRESICFLERAHLNVHPYSQLKHATDTDIVGRNAEHLKTASKAVEKALATFRRIYFVIFSASDSGFPLLSVLIPPLGPLEAPSLQLSGRAFRTVIEIDTVRDFFYDSVLVSLRSWSRSGHVAR